MTSPIRDLLVLLVKMMRWYIVQQCIIIDQINLAPYRYRSACHRGNLSNLAPYRYRSACHREYLLAETHYSKPVKSQSVTSCGTIYRTIYAVWIKTFKVWYGLLALGTRFFNQHQLVFFALIKIHRNTRRPLINQHGYKATLSELWLDPCIYIIR